MYGIYAYWAPNNGELECIYVGVDKHIETHLRYKEHNKLSKGINSSSGGGGKDLGQAFNVWLQEHQEGVDWHYSVIVPEITLFEDRDNNYTSIIKQMAHVMEKSLQQKYKPRFNILGTKE